MQLATAQLQQQQLLPTGVADSRCVAAQTTSEPKRSAVQVPARKRNVQKCFSSCFQLIHKPVTGSENEKQRL